jgi:hypothetical protein
MTARRSSLNWNVLSWEACERLVADLLKSEGLSRVESQPRGTRAFDIIALEEASSCIDDRFYSRVGVQVKHHARPIGPKVLDGLEAEAAERGIRKVLLVSPSGFTPSVALQAESIERRGQIQRVLRWDEQTLQSMLRKRLDLLARYFGPCVSPLSLDASYAGSEEAFSPGTSRGRKNPIRLQKDAGRREPYETYVHLQHVTTIGKRVYRQDGLRHLRDRVAYTTQLLTSKPFVFEFVRKTAAWLESHGENRNEYTWQVPSEIRDLRDVAQYFDVQHMTVCGLRVPRSHMLVERDRIRIEMYSPDLARVAGQIVQVHYNVESLQSTSSGTLMSSLHAKAENFAYVLESVDGFKRQPSAKLYVANENSATTTFDDTAATPCLAVMVHEPVERGLCLVFNW